MPQQKDARGEEMFWSGFSWSVEKVSGTPCAPPLGMGRDARSKEYPPAPAGQCLGKLSRAYNIQVWYLVWWRGDGGGSPPLTEIYNSSAHHGPVSFRSTINGTGLPADVSLPQLMRSLASMPQLQAPHILSSFSLHQRHLTLGLHKPRGGRPSLRRHRVGSQPSQSHSMCRAGEVSEPTPAGSGSPAPDPHGRTKGAGFVCAELLRPLAVWADACGAAGGRGDVRVRMGPPRHH